MDILAWLKAKWARPKADAAGMDAAPARHALERCSAAARLSIEFDRLQENRVTLEEYEALVNHVLDDVTTQLADTLKFWREIDPDEFEYEIDRLEVDREECLWRLTWIREQRCWLPSSAANARATRYTRQ